MRQMLIVFWYFDRCYSGKLNETHIKWNFIDSMVVLKLQMIINKLEANFGEFLKAK